MNSFLVSDTASELCRLRSHAEYIQDIAADIIVNADEDVLRRISNSGVLDGFLNTLEDMIVYLNEWANTKAEEAEA